MDSFSPTFKIRSCKTEVSPMGKKPISYRQRWEKIAWMPGRIRLDLKFSPNLATVCPCLIENPY